MAQCYLGNQDPQGIDNKADKQIPSAENNVALLDSAGNLVDSGKPLTPAGIGAASESDLDNKADKKVPSVANNVALLDLKGNLADSGKQLTSEGIGADPKGAGLYSDFTEIPANSDLNDYTACGYYRQGSSSTGSTISNCPVQGAFILIVSNALGYDDSVDIAGKTWRYRQQRFILLGGDEYTRYIYSNGSGEVTYQNWKTVLNDTNGKAVDSAKADGITDYTDSSKVIKIGWQGSSLTSKTVKYLAGYTSEGNIKDVTWGAAADKLATYVMFTGSEDGASLVLSDIVINRVCSGSSIRFGTWTPTIADATVSSYSKQQGWYLKIGNVVIVGWYMYVKFASGQTANKYKITGLPYTPSAECSGGGVCSGYYSADQVNFSAWYAATNGNIYAYGLTNGAAGNKWAAEEIFCGTGESFSTGTIIYRTLLEDS